MSKTKTEYATGTAMHPLLRKWWMRTRLRVVEIVGTNVPLAAGVELYCPLWALPLDALHAALFGSTKLQPL